MLPVFLLTLGYSFPVGDVPTLDAVIEANRLAVRSIRSMRGRYEIRFRSDNPPTNAVELFEWPTPDGEFWQVGPHYRLRFAMANGSAEDSLYRDGDILTLVTGSPYTNGEPRLFRRNRVNVRRDGGLLWQLMLFSHWGRDVRSFVPCDDLVRETWGTPAVERRGGDVVVTLTHKSGRLELTFDPAANYLVRRSVTDAAGTPTTRWEHEVTKFGEPQKGVFVPLAVRSRCLLDGVEQATAETVFPDLNVNDPETDDALRLDFAGVPCDDVARGVRYTVDADGKQTGPDEEFQGFRSPRWRATPPPVPPPPAEPWWVWVVCAGMLVALGAAVRVVFRYRPADD